MVNVQSPDATQLWVQILALYTIFCVTLGKSLNPSELHGPRLKPALINTMGQGYPEPE